VSGTLYRLIKLLIVKFKTSIRSTDLSEFVNCT